MRKINLLCFIAVLFVLNTAIAQRQDIRGQLISEDEVEGLHVLNKTASKYTISDEEGQFLIPAKAEDTLIISGIKYQKQTFIITTSIMEEGTFTVRLVEHVNELNEVIVGKILTGSLESDIENSDAKTEINFYDLGIPGNIKEPLTQNERKLHDADAGPMGYVGLGAGLNLHKFLNTVSGRTKKLKEIVALDDKDRCIERCRRDYEAFLFENDSLAQNLRNEYFLYCQEDDAFLTLCNQNNELKLLEFLQVKLQSYQENRNSSSKD